MHQRVSFSEAKTTYGIIGVRVLVYKGNTLAKGETPVAAPVIEQEQRKPRKAGAKHATAS